MPNSTIVEICVDAVDSALAAQRGGANRVELCSNLLEGGVTPSLGLLKTVRSKLSISIQVMVRPRGGDFCYSTEEFEIMQHDIIAAKLNGADGIVFGLLNIDGSIDVSRTKQLVDLASPLPVTFHRAFDVTRDISIALEDVINTGVHRILTSGGQPSASEGAQNLASLINTAGPRITILAGGGINYKNIREIIEKTGVQEVHAGLRSIQSSPMQQGNKKISPATAGLDESQRFIVLQENVEKMIQALA